MEKIKQLGIWMDHSNALLMEHYNHLIVSKQVILKPVEKEKEDNVDTHEVQMHSVEDQQHQTAYYNEIREIIKNYKDVLLFGPTDAKEELYNLLKADHHFENTNIELRNTDKMPENKIHEFVIDHFN
jgi:Lhr-like helicase